MNNQDDELEAIINRCDLASRYSDVKAAILAWHNKRLEPLKERIAQDDMQFYKLQNVIKQYGVVGYVKMFKEAQKLGWRDIRLPVPVDHVLSDYEPISELSKSKEE